MAGFRSSGHKETYEVHFKEKLAPEEYPYPLSQASNQC